MGSHARAQLASAHIIEDMFALCFGSVEGDGALMLGAAALPPGVTLLYTPLLRSQVRFKRGRMIRCFAGACQYIIIRALT